MKTPAKLSFDRQGMKAPVSLKRSESAWVPKRERKGLETKSEKISKDIRGLLNKITPTTYNELSEDFCERKVYNQDAEILDSLVNIIFAKAVDEPHFCGLYADLCKKQCDLEKKENGSDIFNNAIIKKCQDTFESKASEQLTGEAQQTSDEDIALEKVRRKKQIIGTIMLIAQLYQRSIIRCNVIVWCLVELGSLYEREESDKRDEIFIEYSVHMVETVGSKFHRDRDRDILSFGTEDDGTVKTSRRMWTRVINWIGGTKDKLSARLRFMVVHMEELAKNNWDDEEKKAKGPKTLAQIEREEKAEEEMNIKKRREFERRNTMRQTNTGSVYTTRGNLPHANHAIPPSSSIRVQHGAFQQATVHHSGSVQNVLGRGRVDRVMSNVQSRKPSPAGSVKSFGHHQREMDKKRAKATQNAEKVASSGGPAPPIASLRDVGNADAALKRNQSMIGGPSGVYRDYFKNHWKGKDGEGNEKEEKDKDGKSG